jgi:hypothetical protein
MLRIILSFLEHPFWKAILHDNDLFDLGFNKNFGFSAAISFWDDKWFNQCALYCSYSLLYSITIYPNITVANAYITDILTLNFRR